MWQRCCAGLYLLQLLGTALCGALTLKGPGRTLRVYLGGLAAVALNGKTLRAAEGVSFKKSCRVTGDAVAGAGHPASPRRLYPRRQPVGLLYFYFLFFSCLIPHIFPFPFGVFIIIFEAASRSLLLGRTGPGHPT